MKGKPAEENNADIRSGAEGVIMVTTASGGFDCNWPSRKPNLVSFELWLGTILHWGGTEKEREFLIINIE